MQWRKLFLILFCLWGQNVKSGEVNAFIAEGEELLSRTRQFFDPDELTEQTRSELKEEIKQLFYQLRDWERQTVDQFPFCFEPFDLNAFKACQQRYQRENILIKDYYTLSRLVAASRLYRVELKLFLISSSQSIGQADEDIEEQLFLWGRSSIKHPYPQSHQGLYHYVDSSFKCLSRNGSIEKISRKQDSLYRAAKSEVQERAQHYLEYTFELRRLYPEVKKLGFDEFFENVDLISNEVKIKWTQFLIMSRKQKNVLVDQYDFLTLEQLKFEAELWDGKNRSHATSGNPLTVCFIDTDPYLVNEEGEYWKRLEVYGEGLDWLAELVQSSYGAS